MSEEIRKEPEARSPAGKKPGHFDPEQAALGALKIALLRENLRKQLDLTLEMSVALVVETLRRKLGDKGAEYDLSRVAKSMRALDKAGRDPLGILAEGKATGRIDFPYVFGEARAAPKVRAACGELFEELEALKAARLPADLERADMESAVAPAEAGKGPKGI